MIDNVRAILLRFCIRQEILKGDSGPCLVLFVVVLHALVLLLIVLSFGILTSFYLGLDVLYCLHYLFITETGLYFTSQTIFITVGVISGTAMITIVLTLCVVNK